MSQFVTCSDLKLLPETKPHKAAIKELESNIRAVERKLASKKREQDKLQHQVRTLAQEVKDAENDLVTLKEAVEEDVVSGRTSLFMLDLLLN